MFTELHLTARAAAGHAECIAQHLQQSALSVCCCQQIDLAGDARHFLHLQHVQQSGTPLSSYVLLGLRLLLQVAQQHQLRS